MFLKVRFDTRSLKFAFSLPESFTCILQLRDEVFDQFINADQVAGVKVC